MAQSTRDQLLATARSLFAERGFYGVSIANVADELGLTKQALLHHFSTKETLYGEVLTRIAEEFAALRAQARAQHGEPVAQVRSVFLGLIARTPQDAQRARLLMRELLDNKSRADTAGGWRLKPLLEDLIAMVKATPRWRDATDAQALALVYQLVGAVSYYAISEPTLRGIFGDEGAAMLAQAYPAQFSALIDAALEAGPGPEPSA